MVIWSPSVFLALYYGCLEGIYVFYSDDDIGDVRYNSVSMVILNLGATVELSLYLVSTCFNPVILWDIPLLLHAWTDLKSIFPDFLCRKVLPFAKKNPWLDPHFGGVWT